MPAVVLATGLVLLASMAGNRRAWIAQTPRVAVRWASALLVTAVGFTYAGLVLLAAPQLARALPVPGALSEACLQLLTGTGPAGTLIACAALGLLGVSAYAVVGRVGRTRSERRDLRVEPGFGTHEYRPGFDLVTVPCRAPIAYSLGGRRPQVVLSTGLLGRLDERGRAAVVEHEAAHVRAGHDHLLGLAAVADSALWFVPWARSATATLRLLLERWADDEASRAVGRPAVRAALLAAVDADPLPAQVASLSRAGALARRLEALDDPGRSGRGSVLAMAAATVGVGLVAALAVIAQLCAA